MKRIPLSRGTALFTALLIWLLAGAGIAQARELPDFTWMVERYGPAVVNISTTQKVGGSPHLPPELNLPDLPEDSPLRDFLRRFFGEDGEGGDEGIFNSKSLGSGFIISRDGYLLTNYHVIRDADEIIVRLSDRRELIAELIGSDERSDLALLKVDADDLPMVEVGSSEDLKVGEWVLAIGSPFGFDHSVTAGIVSAKGRSLPSENYVPFIQTDVAINPGNSGGPLFNLDGEVVGINSQIYSRTGGFMGLSFAIPIDMAMQVVDQLKTQGYVSRGWLGVLIQNVTRDLAESFGMDQPRGALVAQVMPDSPAARAGIQVGDVIVEFDGHVVDKSSELPPLVGATKVGSSVPVKLIRAGKQRNLKIEIGELPEEESIATGGGKPEPSPIEESRFGLMVADLSDEQRGALGVEQGGVMVESVKPGAARAAGIRQGDLILRLNNQDVESAKQFRELIKSLPGGKSAALLVQRDGNPLFLALRVPEGE